MDEDMHIRNEGMQVLEISPPEPGRLEIAAKILAGIAANPADAYVQRNVAASKALACADELIRQHHASTPTGARAGAPDPTVEPPEYEEAVEGYDAPASEEA